MEIMHSFVSQLLFCILVVNGLEKTEALSSVGEQLQSKTNAAKSSPKSPFAPNSEIFKIPASRTVNLDFRDSNETKISSELLKVLQDLFSNKALKQDKVILNIKPPKSSNSSFVKNFTTLLRRETLDVVPHAIVGAQSTIFKKKNGEISSLRLTLYVVRREKPFPLKQLQKPHIRKSTKKSSQTKIEEANINITQSENITATIQSVLQQLNENSTENGIDQTDIFLHLISSKNFSAGQINAIQRSLNQVLSQLYPNATTFFQTKLLYGRKTHVSKLEFEIDVKPKSSLKNFLKLQKKTSVPLIKTLNMTVILFPCNSTKPKKGSILVEGTNSIDNTTKTIDYYMMMLSENIKRECVNRSSIILDLLFSTGVHVEEQEKLQLSVQDITHQVFPNSIVSLQTALAGDQQRNITKITINISPKHEERSLKKSLEPKLNNQSVQSTLETLKDDLQNLAPFSEVLRSTQDIIAKDLDLLEKVLKSQAKNTRKETFPIDLTKGASSFSDEFDKLLPDILAKVESSMEPITLAFEISSPNYSSKNTIDSELCSILKLVTSRIPEKTRFGDVDIEVTLLPNSKEYLPYKNENKILQAALLSPSYQLNNNTIKVLDLTKNGMNITNAIDATIADLLEKLPSPNVSKSEFNVNFMIPHNETDLSIEYILDIIRRDIKILSPFSQILIQAQKTIAEDLHLLKIDIALKPPHDDSTSSKKNIEIIPVDLSELGANIHDDLNELLKPLLSNMNQNRPMTFDLKLRPANDIERGRLGNDICSIVNSITKSVPQGVALNEISLGTTVLPDEEPDEEENSEMEESEESDAAESGEENWQYKILNLTNVENNVSNVVLSKLNKFVEGSGNYSSLIPISNFSFILRVPENETLYGIEDTLNQLRDELSVLAPYADIIITTQRNLEDEILPLKLSIELQHQSPRKIFRIDLSKYGDFIPEEVDEVVFDIRKSQHPFGFTLEMNIPKDVDLEAASSEICSVDNIVINNIPKQSILKGTTLRVSISPRDTDTDILNDSAESEPSLIQSDKELTNEEIPEHPFIENEIPKITDSKQMHKYTPKRELRTSSRVQQKKPFGTNEIIKDHETRQLPANKKFEKSVRRPPYFNIQPGTLATPTKTNTESFEMSPDIEPETMMRKMKAYKPTQTRSLRNYQVDDKEHSKEHEETDDWGPEDEIRDRIEEKIPIHKLSTSSQDKPFEINRIIKDYEIPQLSANKKFERSVHEPPHFDIQPKTLANPRKTNTESLEMYSDIEPQTMMKRMKAYKPTQTRSLGNYHKDENQRFREHKERNEEKAPIHKQPAQSLLKTIKSPIGRKSKVMKGDYISPSDRSSLKNKETDNQINQKNKPLTVTRPTDEIVNFLIGENPQTTPKMKMEFETISRVQKPLSRRGNSRPDNSKDNDVNPSKNHTTLMQTSQESNSSSEYPEYSDELEPENLEPYSHKPRNDAIKTENVYDKDSEERKNVDENMNANKKVTIPIKSYNNDQEGVLHYIENLNLSNSTNFNETVTNVARSIIKMLPRVDNETLELLLKIIPPSNITINSLTETTNYIITSLVAALPNDIINVQTKVGKDNGVITYTEIKITVSTNNTLGRQIEEKERLQNDIKDESRIIQNLSLLLDTLKKNVNQEMNIQTSLKYDSNRSAGKQVLRESLYSLVSSILSSIEQNPNNRNFNLNYSLPQPTGGNLNFGDQLRVLLRNVLLSALPFEDVNIQVYPMKANNSTLQIQVSLEPRTNFTTSPIDLDNLNILDVETVLTKVISKFVSITQKSNSDTETIIIDFLFKTTHISSTNLDNIGSVIEDVLDALNLKGELISEDIKLGLTRDRDIVIHIPFKISNLNDELDSSKETSGKKQQEAKTPRPLEMISDLILGV